ncbi:MAG TPA: PHP domain-containing protein [Thermoplasmata archaeon]|nr:PHP domain-containing protein [Thermoplasmata archaeon]
MSDVARLDLHVHSTYSPDSKLRLDAIVGRLAYQGLRGFALTDHNTTRGHAPLAELAATHRAYLFLPGVEVSTVEGHLLAYGVTDAPPRGRPLVETVEWVQAHGGEAVPAHPFRWTHGIGRTVAASAPVRALEGRNGHNSELANLHAEDLAARRQIGTTGGSDAHALADLGRAFTEFDPSVATPDDLLEAIRRGATVGGGKSTGLGGRLALSLRSAALRVGRGFRPV